MASAAWPFLWEAPVPTNVPSVGWNWSQTSYLRTSRPGFGPALWLCEDRVKITRQPRLTQPLFCPWDGAK